MSVFFSYPSTELQNELRKIANKLVAPGKGILAADETVEDMGNKLNVVGLQNTEENRRRFRQLLFTTEKLGEYVSGIILKHETFYQKSDDGTTFHELLNDNGIIPGINVDKGLVPVFGTDGEVTTQGFDDLGSRCAVYKKAGAGFAKFRTVYKIGEHTPSYQNIVDNANSQAKYAAICQANGLVPIVEPDISIQGDHDIDRCQKVTETVLAFVYKALNDHHVFLEGTLLKPNMVTPGDKALKKSTPDEIGAATVAALSRTVPAAVPGMGFLSGGQSEEESVLNLNAINKHKGNNPWTLTFSFGRALTNSVWKTWAGKDKNKPAAQKVLLEKCKGCSLASLGKYQAK